MPIDEYEDGDEVLLLDGSDADDFNYGWNPKMSRLVGKTVVPMSVVRNDRGHIMDFEIPDKEAGRKDRGWWHWDPRFVELTRKETMVPIEDFNSILD